MRRCPGCGELTEYFDAECLHCRYLDSVWAEAVLNGSKQMAERVAPHPLEALRRPSMQLNPSLPRVVVIPVSSFSDSSELAFELAHVDAGATEKTSQGALEVRFDFTQLGFDWESVGAGEEHEFIPGSIGVLALTEACRAVHLACQTWGSARVTAILPPRGHPASELIREAGVLSDLPEANILWRPGASPSSMWDVEGLNLETIVPFTGIGTATNGQLSDLFHFRFDALSARGSIGREFRSPLRQVVMDLAENAAEYGEGGYIGCFLRQEKGRAAGIKGRAGSFLFDPRRHTHLFINCFTLGPSLSAVTGHTSEWSAAQAVLGGGFTSRAQGGGNGMETVMSTVVERAAGTVYLNSKNYVRVVLPNGIVHEYMLGGELYLPGVHICSLIPLAVVAQLYQLNSAKEAIKA